ncbi:trypsin-2-like isoform X2 [Leptopilina boulardi]|uniref:trypsin-2-like isoform X2 n=1 Tax=Leptopilina boulardi TaxID=63433 RepID=UPI0021F5DE45|nr:trypsin-2-like isoform X2 [Leptopilina boulardi]
MRITFSLVWILEIIIFSTSAQGNKNKTILYAQSKVVGGQRLPIIDRPYMLSVHLRQKGFQCGAIILSEEWGLTAQHCLILDPKQYVVRAGSDQFQRGGSLHRVTEVVVRDISFLHERIPLYDIALFKVSPKFRFSIFVQPAKLPSADLEYDPPILVISGWGSTMSSTGNRMSRKEKAVVSTYLMGARVPFVSYEKCSLVYPEILRNNLHICYGGRGLDACTGDSGGPLGDRYTVYGIISFGYGCAQPQIPGVYTRLSTHREWIRTISSV